MKTGNKKEFQKNGPPSGKDIPKPNGNSVPVKDNEVDPEENPMDIEEPDKKDVTRIDDPPPTKPVKPVK